MSRIRFISKDAEAAPTPNKELEKIVAAMEGVNHWIIFQDGTLTLEYDQSSITEETLEETFDEVGLKAAWVSI